MSGRRRRGTMPASAGRQNPKRTRPGVDGAGGSKALCTQGSGPSEVLPSSGIEKGSSSARVMIRDLMVDQHVLDCCVCFLPLKPPIFQCGVGHVLCSSCSEKLKDVGKCHLCGVSMPSGYQRCHAMEGVMDSICGPCPHAPYGCDTTPVYHAREEHIRECPHAPSYCPGEECSFVGSKAGLLDHCSTAHRWPCNTTVKASPFGYYAVCLHDGFNLLVADLYTGNNSQDATANKKCLFLLTVARQPYARIISVCCLDPHAATATAATASGGQGPTSKEMRCVLQYNLYTANRSHTQSSTARVVCTDLSNGLPKPDDSFQFIVPNQVIEDPEKDGIQVHVQMKLKTCY